MTFRLGLASAFWAAILVIVLQLAPTPALAHAGHTHHMGDVTAFLHKAATPASDHHAASQAKRPVAQAVMLSSAPASSPDPDIDATCTGGCCGTGAGCCGAVMLGAAIELPDFGPVIRVALLAPGRRSGIVPDGLASPPRILAA
jgi:hypothetical protein